MIVQDLIIMIGSIGFSIALLPSIFSGSKPSWQTSLMTGGILVVFAGCYATLGLIYAAITTVVTATLWSVLLFQVLRRR